MFLEKLFHVFFLNFKTNGSETFPAKLEEGKYESVLECRMTELEEKKKTKY